MKKSLVSTLIAAPLLTLSSLAFAQEAAPSEPLSYEEPMLLSMVEMDDVTAGRRGNFSRPNWSGGLTQINISPVIIVQVAVLNFGDVTQFASVVSGNFFSIRN